MTWIKIIVWKSLRTRVQFKNWCWKPKIVRVFKTSEIYEIYSAIKAGRISSDANRFILERGYLLWSEGRCWSKDKIKLKKLLKLLEISQGSSIKINRFIISFNSKPEKASTLVSNAKVYFFIFKEKIYRIESTHSQTYLRGSIFDLDNKYDRMMINWEEFRSLDATITSGDSNSDPHSDLCESLSNLDANNKINMYVLFKKTDIIKFICYNLKDLQEAWNYPNVTSIDFSYPIEKFDMEENIYALESTPKYFTIDIDWNKNLKCLTDEQLWKSLTQFRFVKLHTESIGSILIDREGQDLDVANTHKDEIRISVANKETSKIIQEIKSSLILIDKKYPRENQYNAN